MMLGTTNIKKKSGGKLVRIQTILVQQLSVCLSVSLYPSLNQLSPSLPPLSTAISVQMLLQSQ